MSVKFSHYPRRPLLIISTRQTGRLMTRREFMAFLLRGTSCTVSLCQLAAGTCEIVTLNKDSSQPRRTIARQTARCACKKGQIAGTTRARPACVDAGIVRKRQWCEMVPCLEDEGCDLLVNKSGWTCTQPGGRVKTTTVS
ncbi:chemokine-like protein TAFA-5a isoform X1 [Gambusia affinis]|uniref:chemokine-like protein TAFA-5a isoform X1 n=1 Tax=Gambusia affinis TaxID=33528 RepID=UPI001CDD2E5F|nr:chemokine-like protein TAFA-5a isoform X1 [Gambusia affinis]